MSQPALNLIPRLPHRYDWVEHPITGMQYAFGDDVTDIVLESVQQRYLVLPLPDSPHAVRLSNTYYEQCAAHQIPFVRISVGPAGWGEIFWNMETGPAGPFRQPVYELLATELAYYYLDLPAEFRNRARVKGKDDAWYIEPHYGSLAFPPGHTAVLELVLAYVSDQTAFGWLDLAPDGEAA